MKTSGTLKIVLLSVCFSVTACALTTGVLSKGDNTFTINVNRGDMSKVKLRAYQHAEKFCAEKSGSGISVVKEDLRADPAAPTAGIIDLDFKCQGPVTAKIGLDVMKAAEKNAKKNP